MKQIRISYLFFALPLVFFVLSGSPNLTGPRIGITLGVASVLFILVSYLLHRTKGNSAQIFKISDALFIIVILGCMIAGRAVSYKFVFLIPIWPLLMLIQPKHPAHRLLAQFFHALLLFIIIYFGINQYDFTNLMNTRVVLLGLVFVFQYFFISSLYKRPATVSIPNRIREIQWNYFAALLSLGLFSWLLFDIKYLIYLGAIALPTSFLIYMLSSKREEVLQSKLIKRFTILSILGLIVFNLYLFLDSTQVLQAVMGGY